MGDAFGQRYLVASYRTGGVVVDLVSGNYYQVNRSAAVVCEALCTGGDVEGRLSAEFHVPREEIPKLIAVVTAELAAPAVRDSPQGAYHFYPTALGYVLVHDERTVLEINGPDLDIRLPPDSPVPSKGQLELYVRALAPKLLFQRGFVVIHASACEVSGKMVAFAGLSGAGKTTTAHAFAAAGATLVSEDLVVIQADKHPRVFVEAERAIHSWAQHLADRLTSDPLKPQRPGPLASFAEGVTVRLDQILFLHQAERSGSEFDTFLLSEPDALISLMTHDFLGAVEPYAWRRFFSSAVALLTSVDLRRMSAPSGLGVMLAAASRYISRTAS
jgi:hypothetical protein